ncbi:MAG: hypothetical protein ABI411_08665 [Tahibacter sp.]
MTSISIARVRSQRSRGTRMLAVLLLLGATALGALLLMPTARDLVTPGAVIGSDTPFAYVAVFPPATRSDEIEQWRAQVLRVHRVACTGARACVARSLRLSGIGKRGQETLAFDLMPDTPPDERRAIVDTALVLDPRVLLVENSSANAAIR